MPVSRTDNTAACKSAIRNAVADGLSEVGSKVVGYAQSTVHVVTGNLRDSIGYDSNDTEVVVSASMDYAQYEELGTSRQQAHPYLRPAVMDHTDEIVNTIANKIRNAL